jgi:hypothetical protein
MNKKCYVAAGGYFKSLRESAGFNSRSMFVDTLREICGSTLFDYNSLTRLENGYTEPKIVHFLAYQRATNCDPAAIASIPGLLS